MEQQLPVNLTLEGNSTFLENTECVPYYKSNASGYYPALLPQEQEIGWIVPLECEIPEFPVPRLPPRLPNNSFYECCKIGTLPQQRYYTNDDFYATVSIELVVYSLAAIASALIAVGLLVPLLADFLPQKQRERTSNPDSSMRSSSRSKSRRIAASAPHPPRYSTYNLYLIYLAIPDLVYALLRIWIDGCMLAQKEIPNGWENGRYYGSGSSWPSLFLWSYLMANLVMNAVISYEVLVLLRSSRAVQRIRQPNLKRANLQGLAVYAFSVLYAVGMWALVQRSTYFGEIFIMNGRIIPILYVLGVNFVIWWRGYLPPSSRRNNTSPTTPSERAMRTLALYFFRIVYVFILVWVPGLVFMRYGHNTRTRWANFLYLLLPAIQAIVSTGMILTKPDVRKHVWNLLSLYHCKTCFPRKQSVDQSVGASKTAATARASLSVPKKFLLRAGNREDNDEGANDRNNDGCTANNNSVQYARMNDTPEDSIRDHPVDVEKSGITKTSSQREDDTCVSNFTSTNDASVSNYTTSSSIEIIFPSTNSEVGSHSINITHPTISEVDG